MPPADNLCLRLWTNAFLARTIMSNPVRAYHLSIRNISAAWRKILHYFRDIPRQKKRFWVPRRYLCWKLRYDLRYFNVYVIFLNIYFCILKCASKKRPTSSLERKREKKRRVYKWPMGHLCAACFILVTIWSLVVAWNFARRIPDVAASPWIYGIRTVRVLALQGIRDGIR